MSSGEYLSPLQSICVHNCFRLIVFSSTAGHPENELHPAIEVSTGPLGQGISNSVGMALAEKHLEAEFNSDDMKIIDNHVFTICSDGDLQEGVSSEASSLAGHLGLGKLIALYDDNKISIDGQTELSFSEDVLKRYEAYGWHVQRVADGNQDFKGIAQAIENAKNVTDKPSMIAVKTYIGYGTLKENTAGLLISAHLPTQYYRLVDVIGECVRRCPRFSFG